MVRGVCVVDWKNVMHTAREFAHTISLADSSGNVRAATLTCEARDWNEGGFSRRTCVIKLRCDALEVEGEASDFFDAFCRVRERLEPLGLKPLCYGASRNVFPSSMARDMGEGLKAYKMRLGQPATVLVSIFAEGPDVEPASVATQHAFWGAWLRSLGHTPGA
jgi:hypothetical protein